jgi:hypothetical protein
MPDYVTQFKAHINANCAFDSLGVTANVGGVREIRGWSTASGECFDSVVRLLHRRTTELSRCQRDRLRAEL